MVHWGCRLPISTPSLPPRGPPKKKRKFEKKMKMTKKRTPWTGRREGANPNLTPNRKPSPSKLVSAASMWCIGVALLLGARVDDAQWWSFALCEINIHLGSFGCFEMCDASVDNVDHLLVEQFEGGRRSYILFSRDNSSFLVLVVAVGAIFLSTVPWSRKVFPTDN